MNARLLASVIYQLENLCNMLEESCGKDSAEYYIANQQKEILEAIREENLREGDAFAKMPPPGKPQ